MSETWESSASVASQPEVISSGSAIAPRKMSTDPVYTLPPSNVIEGVVSHQQGSVPETRLSGLTSPSGVSNSGSSSSLHGAVASNSPQLRDDAMTPSHRNGPSTNVHLSSDPLSEQCHHDHMNNRVPTLAFLASTVVQAKPHKQSCTSKPVQFADAAQFPAHPTGSSSTEMPASDKIKRKRSTHKSKKKASLRQKVPGFSSVGKSPLEHTQTLKTDQVQSEIEAIDSILKELNTGCYNVSNMGTLAQLTDGAKASVMSGDMVAAHTAVKVHAVVKPVDSVSSIQSYDSRLDSTSSNSCSSTESSDESVDIGMPCHRRQQEVKEEEEEGCKDRRDSFFPKTRGETFYMELPPVEKCEVGFPNSGRLLPIATVSHYTEKLLILSSIPDTPPVNEGTVLWTEGKTSIAKVFETFGPVKRPFYSIRINSLDDLRSLGVALRDTVYIIPDNPILTKYIFPQELMKQKGSDASWKDDNEVPSQFQDYSDDEREQKVSRTRKKVKATQSQSEKREQSRGVVRQPSVKYTNDPHMQHYFPRAADIPDQLFRPSTHTFNNCGQSIPPFIHTAHLDINHPPQPSMPGAISPFRPHISPREMHSTVPNYYSPAFVRPLLPQWHPLPPPPPPPPPY